MKLSVAQVDLAQRVYKMKAILSTGVYDTKTARKIVTYTNGKDENDISFIAETLYKKASGHYFLLGEGGTATRYGTEKFGIPCKGNVIIPITGEKASLWITHTCKLTGEQIESLGEDEYFKVLHGEEPIKECIK